jgi:hypothetical protein
MRLRWFAACTGLLMVLGMGCGDDNPSGPSEDEITGTWQATKVEYTTSAGVPMIDLIALGGSASLVLNADNSLVYTVTPAGGSANVTTGTWQLSANMIAVTPSGMPFSWQFDVEYTSDELRMSGADVEFDYDDDDIDEPAKLNLVFTR